MVRNPMVFCFLAAGAAVAAAVAAAGCVASTKDQPKLKIGDVCTHPAQCAAVGAVCVPRGDAQDRCWSASCYEDPECGLDAACVKDATSLGAGTCYRLCETVEDCPEGSSNSKWYCDRMLVNETEIRVCNLEPNPFCGNATVERGEECDDGNYHDGDGCTAECETEEGCGNGRLDVYIDEYGAVRVEECDDDNVESWDGCSSNCKIEGAGAACGNGILEIGEGCDPPEAGVCNQLCKREDGCGNGQLDPGELCDDGNNVTGDGCSTDCMVEFTCGNGLCETNNYETCELCPLDCCPLCGNGELDEAEGEECDDGNNSGGDGCSKGCVDEDGQATCGNDIWEVGEECEDGNTNPQDGCSADCMREFECGDDFCDVDNYETCRLCPSDCCPSCGNGIREIQYGEKCDRNDLDDKTCLDFCFDGGTLGCTDWCEFDTSQCTGTGPICGDGTAECEEQCDNNDLKGRSCASLGYSQGTLSCDNNCHLDVSNCSGLVWYLAEDFEGVSVANWTFNADWQVGTPFATSPPEPQGAHGGQYCAGTVIGGNYANNNTYTGCTLDSPQVDLALATAPVLAFYQYVHAETSWDGGNVWVSVDNGVNYTFLDNNFVNPDYYDSSVGTMWAYSGNYSALGWHRVTVNLANYAGQTIRIRFAFYSDSSVNSYAGWYIDDIIITEPALLPVFHETAPALGTATVGVLFNASLQASGGTGVYQWSITGGTNHTWLSIDTDTGVLSGTPGSSNTGPGTVTVRVEESTVPSNFDLRDFTFTVQ